MPGLTEPEIRNRFASSPVARLATVRRSGGPRLVPITFVLSGDTIFTAVDEKPKTTRRLRRLDDIRANPAVSVLVDGYEADWSRLWWARADGSARISDSLTEAQPGLELLVDKYVQYRELPPGPPVIAITVTRWVGWTAAAEPTD